MVSTSATVQKGQQPEARHRRGKRAPSPHRTAVLVLRLWSVVGLALAFCRAVQSTDDSSSSSEVQRIRDQIFAGVPANQSNATVFFLGGGSHSGKGAVASNYTRFGVPVPARHAYVNTDVVMTSLDAWNETYSAYPLCAANLLHTHAHELSSMYFQEAMLGRYTTVWDGTFHNLSDSMAKLDLARAYNFTVYLVGVSHNTRDSVEACVSRARKTGQWIELSAVLTSHENFVRNFFRYLPYTDKAMVVDTNSGYTPTLVFEQGLFYNNSLMEKFLRKGWETDDDIMDLVSSDTLTAYEEQAAACSLTSGDTGWLRYFLVFNWKEVFFVMLAMAVFSVLVALLLRCAHFAKQDYMPIGQIEH